MNFTYSTYCTWAVFRAEQGRSVIFSDIRLQGALPLIFVKVKEVAGCLQMAVLLALLPGEHLQDGHLGIFLSLHRLLAALLLAFIICFSFIAGGFFFSSTFCVVYLESNHVHIAESLDFLDAIRKEFHCTGWSFEIFWKAPSRDGCSIFTKDVFCVVKVVQLASHI